MPEEHIPFVQLHRKRLESVFLNLPDLQPTWSMEILCHLRGTNGAPFTRTVHNTIHQLGSTAGDP